MLIILSGWSDESTRIMSEKNIGMSESSISKIMMEEGIGDIHDIYVCQKE